MRLRQKVVAAGLDRLHAIGRVVERGDEDDGDACGARIALEPPADLEARGAVVAAEGARRHRDVENAEVRPVRVAGVDRRRAIDRFDDAVAERAELIVQQLDVRRNVVGDENQRRGGSAVRHGLTV